MQPNEHSGNSLSQTDKIVVYLEVEEAFYTEDQIFNGDHQAEAVRRNKH